MSSVVLNVFRPWYLNKYFCIFRIYFNKVLSTSWVLVSTSQQGQNNLKTWKGGLKSRLWSLQRRRLGILQLTGGIKVLCWQNVADCQFTLLQQIRLKLSISANVPNYVFCISGRKDGIWHVRLPTFLISTENWVIRTHDLNNQKVRTMLFSGVLRKNYWKRSSHHLAKFLRLLQI